MDSRMRDSLDSWITSGRYSKEYLLVTCSNCDENSIVECETEYGASWWTPEECKYCGEEFNLDTEFETYYPEEEIC
jgi:hypothetical protein